MTTIRAATSGDVVDIARIHIASAREAERGLVPDRALDVDVDARQRMWRRIVTGDRHPVHVVVAEEAGRTVGFAASGPSRDDAGAGEVHAVYVDPAAQGRGHGSALLEAAERDLADRGFEGAVLWVLAANAPTIAFYRAHGWRDDGDERVEQVRGVEVVERRHRKRLDATRPHPAGADGG